MCALEAEEGLATSLDGRRIFYRVQGRGPFAMVMPVPWGLDSYIQSRGFSSLDSHLALVTFDPRGVGRSDAVASEGEYSQETLADDAATVADAVRLPRCVVLGHSGGGAVALTYALAFPGRVSHLVLLSTAAWWSEPSPLRTDVSSPSTEEEMRKRFRAEIARSVRRPEVFQHSMDELLSRMRFSPERLRWIVTVGATSYDVRSRLSEIRVPTLIVHGRQDGLVLLERAQELQAGIPGSRLVILEECGHWPHVEQRAQFVAAVKEFLGLEDRTSQLF